MRYRKPTVRSFRPGRRPVTGTQKKRRFLAAAGAVLILSGILLEWRLAPVIQTMSRNQANAAAVRAVNQAVSQELQDHSEQYAALIQLHQDSSGMVMAVETDVAAVDLLKSEMSQKILDALENSRQNSFSIPVGTLLGGSWLSGRGPEISFRLVPSRSIQLDIDGSFTSAGINQTRHLLRMTVNLEVEAVGPGLSAKTQVDCSYLLADTIIVGNVPNAYAEISGYRGEDPQNFKKQDVTLS